MATYGVWVNEYVDNDSAEYYEDRETASELQQELAGFSEDGDNIYMAEFDDDGEIVENTMVVLRNEDGGINEYDEHGQRRVF